MDRNGADSLWNSLRGLTQRWGHWGKRPLGLGGQGSELQGPFQLQNLGSPVKRGLALGQRSRGD